MGVFPITHPLSLVKLQGQSRGKIDGIRAGSFSKPVGNRPIIGSGILINFDSQLEVGCHRNFTAILFHLSNNRRIVCGINQNRYKFVIFRRTPQHCRPTNINVFNRILKAATLFRHRRLKWIKIHHNHINRFNVVFRHGINMLGIITQTQQRPVNLGVEGFYPTVHHFGKTGIIRNIHHRDSSLADHLCRSTG